MTQLFLVSIGPGDPELISPKAINAIDACSDVVAYGLYLELLDKACQGKTGPSKIDPGKTHHELPLGQEIERARLALDLAASGKITALVSSGDIGIYAMASAVFELLDYQLSGHERNPKWLDVDLEIIPGISAMQANSSAVGALLGHDFCAISLSDLLTPWETIENRVHSAGSGDFVVTFYNPVSKKRDWQLNTARDILLQYRPGATPTVLGRNLTRDGHSVNIITLDQLNASQVDMFTCVSVGNRESRHIINHHTHWVYTPRGYSPRH
ncbi:precorrin-3B C(17)-methyltransferase [Candidatus Spongiihabitans sp.]|uniref:precorrin-3B C(17)-methyltransferase n=1 Tax=Candidatus Spongiihabitans sp. TaxID=3101308 RepID=UPI003C6FD637